MYGLCGKVHLIHLIFLVASSHAGKGHERDIKIDADKARRHLQLWTL